MGVAHTRIAIAVVLVWAASPSAALAEPGARDKSIEVGGSIGVFLPADNHELYDPAEGMLLPLATGPQIAVRAAYLFKRYAGAEVEADASRLGVDGADGSALVMAVRGHALIQQPSRIAPFAIVGVGLLMSKSSDLGDDTDSMAYVGVGVKYYWKDNLALRLDARVIRSSQAEADAAGDGTNHGEVLLGVSWQFGGVAPPPPPEVKAGPADSDGDGLIDPKDKCPNEPETQNGFEDCDGCLDEISDADGDGILPPKDGCPDKPEDADGFEDDDGCPDLDNDGDGVVDASDQCRDESGVVENRGCPDADEDGDGVVDRLDNCPKEAGSADNYGCKGKQLVELKQDAIEIKEKVYFDHLRARVKSRSRPLLNNIAQVLKDHPEIKLLRIEGHTDSSGDPEFNKGMSQKRADRVRDYLVKQGVEPERLEAVGFGEEKPIVPNDSDDNRAKNRRVEFNIVER